MRPTEPIREHHKHLMKRLGIFEKRVMEFRKLSGVPLRRVAKGEAFFLLRELRPHAQAEERYLYPVVDNLAKAKGVKLSATMRLDHEAIEKYVADFVKKASRVTPFVVPGLERAAWELVGLLKVHFEKEERVYLPLVDGNLKSAEVMEKIVEPMERFAERHAREKV